MGAGATAWNCTGGVHGVHGEAAMGGGGDGDGRRGLEERSRGEEWRRDAGWVGVWHVNRYTSTAGGQTQAYTRGTCFLLRSTGRRPPVVISFSGGRRQLSARGDTTTGVRDGWPPEGDILSFVFAFFISFFYILVFNFLSILLKGLFSYKNVQKMYDLIK